ncbi:STIP1 y and U box-containing protein 1 [Thoreauomyces humboldtii]|nr:STIP1 y and U box-containing protein 1 [Thoreauomyces humboldtii]
MATTADSHKLKGNEFFTQQLYTQAIQEYGIAIVRRPDVPTYYTNRALCHIRLGNSVPAVTDAEKAIELDVKFAHALAVEQKVLSPEEVGKTLVSAKKRKWEILDAKRRNEDSDLHRYLSALVQRDRQRQIGQLDPGNRVDISSTNEQFDDRLSQITGLFTRAEDDQGKRREVPDCYVGKISFDVMTDPVVTPSGITYDRSEILSHLRKIGHFDPLTRLPMSEKDLVPNLALKEAIDEFLSNNGWAVDY